MDDRMEAIIAKAAANRARVIEEAIAEVGQAGGGAVYVEPPGLRRDNTGRMLMTVKLWKVLTGQAKPAGLPERCVRYDVPAMLRG